MAKKSPIPTACYYPIGMACEFKISEITCPELQNGLFMIIGLGFNDSGEIEYFLIKSLTGIAARTAGNSIGMSVKTSSVEILTNYN